MAEFKISNPLISENQAFRVAGTQLNDDFSEVSTDGINTLAAALEFAAEQKRIKTLIALYMQLVAKDAADIEAMIENVKAMDSSVAASVGS